MVRFLKKISILFLFILIFGCNSVNKFNQHIETKIVSTDLIKDIDFVEKKLTKLHPSLYTYITKEELKFKFDSLRKAMIHPLTPNQFFLGISEVVSSVRQGHTRIIPLNRRLTRKKIKELKKRGEGVLSKLSFRYDNNKLWVVKNYSKDTIIKKGMCIERIQGVTPMQLFEKYKKTYSSDGFNKTFYSHSFASRFIALLALEKPVLDSISIVLNYQGKTFPITLIRKNIVLNKSKHLQTVTNHNKPKKINRRIQRIFEYDRMRKEYNRHLYYIPSDSSIAVFKINGFTHSAHKKAYNYVFDELKRKKVRTLILDLRNNGGGSLMEIKELFSYLSNQSVVFIDTMKITNRTSFATNKLRNFSPPLLALFSPILLPYTINNILLTRKDKYGNFYIKSPIRKPVKLKSNKFEGNLYVLINGGSFSASSILSANLKNINRATFVGEETGGAYNSTVAGTLPILTLPYSKLRFRVGLQDIGVIKKTDTIGRGIFPDVEIKPNELDLLKDIDPEIEYIVKREKLDNK